MSTAVPRGVVSDRMQWHKTAYVLTQMSRPTFKRTACAVVVLPSGRTAVEHVWPHDATAEMPCTCGAVPRMDSRDRGAWGPDPPEEFVHVPRPPRRRTRPRA
jgi:hypothetical protein